MPRTPRAEPVLRMQRLSQRVPLGGPFTPLHSTVLCAVLTFRSYFHAVNRLEVAMKEATAVASVQTEQDHLPRAGTKTIEISLQIGY